MDTELDTKLKKIFENMGKSFPIDEEILLEDDVALIQDMINNNDIFKQANLPQILKLAFGETVSFDLEKIKSKDSVLSFFDYMVQSVPYASDPQIQYLVEKRIMEFLKLIQKDDVLGYDKLINFIIHLLTEKRSSYPQRESGSNKVPSLISALKELWPKIDFPKMSQDNQRQLWNSINQWGKQSIKQYLTIDV